MQLAHDLGGGIRRLQVLDLAEAEHRREPVAQGRRRLGAHDVVGLAEQPTTFGVPDLGEPHADLRQLGRRDLTREGSGILGCDILRSDRDPRAAEGLERREQLHIRGKHEALDAAVGHGGVGGGEFGDASEPPARVRMPEVHLQAHPDRHARRHQQDPVVSYCPMTATFSAEAEVGSKR
jgi:hypothetical protein